MENEKNNTFKKLLDRLQEDSWQLELLVSGFAIFGLFSAWEPVLFYAKKASVQGDYLSTNLCNIGLLSIAILIVNLLFHLILRGLWIGALGLRYVSGDVEFDELRYSLKFRKYLERKIGSFDDYIEKLEKLSSVIFSITFLLIFYLISFNIIGSLVAFLSRFTSDEYPSYLSIPASVIFYAFLIGAVISFLDLVTQGFFKKQKWLSKIYFPVYWVFSRLTLSFLYRPLAYNLLDNKFGKRISWFLLPVYIAILFLSSLTYESSNYIISKSTSHSTEKISNSKNYEDEVKENKLFINGVAIQSKVIQEGYLKIKIPLTQKIDDTVFGFNEGLKPEKDERGYATKMKISFNFSNKAVDVKRKQDSLQNEYMNTFNFIYKAKIDSVFYPVDFVIANQDKELSFESYIGIKNLKEGKHVFELLKLLEKDIDSVKSIIKIPFWYYPK